MKTIKLIAVLLTFLSVTACSKLNPLQKEKLLVKIDGDKVTWGEDQFGVTPVLDGLFFECLKTSGLNVEQLSMGIGVYTGVGVYTIDQIYTNGNTATYVKTGLSFDISASSQSGEIEITKVDNEKIEGTFSIVMIDVDSNIINFESGEFKAIIAQ